MAKQWVLTVGQTKQLLREQDRHQSRGAVPVEFIAKTVGGKRSCPISPPDLSLGSVSETPVAKKTRRPPPSPPASRAPKASRLPSPVGPFRSTSWGRKSCEWPPKRFHRSPASGVQLGRHPWRRLPRRSPGLLAQRSRQLYVANHRHSLGKLPWSTPRAITSTTTISRELVALAAGRSICLNYLMVSLLFASKSRRPQRVFDAKVADPGDNL